MGYHVIQFLLFLGRYFLFLNTYVANFACWLASGDSLGIDDSYRIFNVDCRVSLRYLAKISWNLITFFYHVQYPQHTTEWAIPYENSQACLREFREYLQKEQRDPHGIRPHFPVEIRFSAPDDIWLSPSYGRQTCWIGIVQYKWVVKSARFIICLTL